MSENELQLQRLVDGQLDRSQIQQLLGEAQQHPELWQQIASAFVEDQIWKAEIEDCFSATTESVVGSVATSTATALNSAPSVAVNEIEQPVHASTQNHPQTAPARFKLLFSLAAATLIGLWLGNQLGNNKGNNSGAANQVVENTGTVGENSANMKTAKTVPSPGFTFKPVQHVSIGDAGRIPLYTLADAQEMGMTFAEPELPQDLVDKYQRQGYHLKQNTSYISGHTKNGQQIVVPVRSISLNPGN